MYENISEKLKNILEPRLSLFYFNKNNFQFRSLCFKDIENLNIDNFEFNKEIVFLLDSDFENLKSAFKLRFLLTRCVVFTSFNLLNLFGVPERYFYFNPLIDEKHFFLSNTEENKIDGVIYDVSKIYYPDEIRTFDSIKIDLVFNDFYVNDKVFIDVIKFLSCGCSVFISDSKIIDLLPVELKIFLNKKLTFENKLDAQFEIHIKYSYISQVSGIEEQLYGIFGHVNDLI